MSAYIYMHAQTDTDSVLCTIHSMHHKLNNLAYCPAGLWPHTYLNLASFTGSPPTVGGRRLSLPLGEKRPSQREGDPTQFKELEI